MTAAITISLTRQLRLERGAGRLGAVVSVVCDMRFFLPSLEGECPRPLHGRGHREDSTPYTGTNRIRFEGLLCTLSAAVALPCRVGPTAADWFARRRVTQLGPETIVDTRRR